MSQQGMTIVSTVADMGDLEFIQNKVQAGKYFQVSGAIDALNDTIEHIVPNTKLAFLIEAKITMKTNPTPTGPGAVGVSQASVDQVIADLLIDSTVVDKATVGYAARMQWNNDNNAGGPGSALNKGATAWFATKGLSLLGDGAKKIEIKNVLDGGSCFATMSGYYV